MANLLLQTSDLTYLRDEILVALPDTVTIQRKAMTADGQGGFSESWGDAYQSVSARLATPSGSERIAQERIDTLITTTITLPFSQNVLLNDRIIHPDGSFEVVSINENQSWGTAKRCLVRRL